MGVSPARRSEPSRNRRQEKGEANGTGREREANKLGRRVVIHNTPGPWPSLGSNERMITVATAPSTRQRKPRPKPARYARLVIKPDATSLGVVRLTVGGKSVDYLLTPIA